jgi:hypothetical protein
MPLLTVSGLDIEHPLSEYRTLHPSRFRDGGVDVRPQVAAINGRHTSHPASVPEVQVHLSHPQRVARVLPPCTAAILDSENPF